MSAISGDGTDRFLAELDRNENTTFQSQKKVVSRPGKGDILPGIKMTANLNLFERFICRLFGWTVNIEIEEGGKKKVFCLGKESLEKFLLRHRDKAGIQNDRTTLSYNDLVSGLKRLLIDVDVKKMMFARIQQKSKAADEDVTELYDKLNRREFKILTKWKEFDTVSALDFTKIVKDTHLAVLSSSFPSSSAQSGKTLTITQSPSPIPVSAAVVILSSSQACDARARRAQALLDQQSLPALALHARVDDPVLASATRTPGTVATNLASPVISREVLPTPASARVSPIPQSQPSVVVREVQQAAEQQAAQLKQAVDERVRKFAAAAEEPSQLQPQPTLQPTPSSAIPLPAPQPESPPTPLPEPQPAQQLVVQPAKQFLRKGPTKQRRPAATTKPIFKPRVPEAPPLLQVAPQWEHRYKPHEVPANTEAARRGEERLQRAAEREAIAEYLASPTVAAEEFVARPDVLPTSPPEYQQVAAQKRARVAEANRRKAADLSIIPTERLSTVVPQHSTVVKGPTRPAPRKPVGIQPYNVKKEMAEKQRAEESSGRRTPSPVPLLNIAVVSAAVPAAAPPLVPQLTLEQATAQFKGEITGRSELELQNLVTGKYAAQREHIEDRCAAILRANSGIEHVEALKIALFMETVISKVQNVADRTLHAKESGLSRRLIISAKRVYVLDLKHEEPLGLGTFKIVHKAMRIFQDQRRNFEMVANLEMRTPAKRVQMARTEVDIFKRLQDQPGIIPFYIAQEWTEAIGNNNLPDSVTMICRLAEGTLTQRLKTLSNPERVQVAKDVLTGVVSMHSLNIAHCDLKLDNVLTYSSEGKSRAALTDFGLSVVVNPNGKGEKRFPGQYGSISETPPELLLTTKSKVFAGDCKKCDSWALGCMLYTMFVRDDPPWSATLKQASIKAISKKNAQKQMIALAPTENTFQFPQAVPQKVREAILGLLHSDPGKRYTAQQALALINQI